MDFTHFPPAVQKLSNIAIDWETYEWPDYCGMGIGPEHIADLIQILERTPEYWMAAEINEEQDGPKFWTPMHAWRALGQLHALEAIPALLKLLHLSDEFDMEIIQEELPLVFEQIGPAALPALFNYLGDAQNGAWDRLTAAEAAQRIALDNPEYRPKVVDELMAALEGYASQEPHYNGFLILELSKLKAVEAAPLVEEAYRSEMVDELIMGDLEDFQIAVGLLDHRLTSARFNLTTPYTEGMLGKSAAPRREDKKTRQKLKMEKRSRKKNRKKKK